MFLLGTITLSYFLMSRDIFWANVFTITFIFEFFVRVFINPIYAPYMVLGSLIVSNQQPDWVEARPKKFAWILGAILGGLMSYFIYFDVMTPFRLLTCLLCLALLYMEAVFGICLGCIVYKKLNYKLYNCPGGVCEMPAKDKPNLQPKFLLIILFMFIFYGIYWGIKEYKYDGYSTAKMTQEKKDALEFGDDFEDEENDEIQTQNSDCIPPKWAIEMGHKDIWLEHHGCK